MKTYPLLENAPAHDSPEFIDYLREKNVVVYEDKDWIVIENVKYHTTKKPWYTAFAKESHWEITDYLSIVHENGWYDWNWLKKSVDKQTVKRFHIHIYK